ncbi:MAG: V-type ATP synthase subunit F [Archaeoglobales archaeon]|nr:V-type ATP synthase subunit F [Archaeoglobales archaeon]
MKKIAVVGDEDFNLGFMLAGLTDLYNVKKDEDLRNFIRELLEKEDVGIVIIQHDLLKKLPPTLKKEVYESVEPTFVALGGSGDVEEMREKIRRAIGVDLWK